MSIDRDMGRRLAKSAAWMVLLRLTIRSLGLISTLILARLLVPADFGLVALASLIISILELVFDFSFDLYLIRQKGQDTSLYNTVWTLSVLRGSLMGLLIFLAAPLAAAFYASPALVDIYHVLALGSFISGFENVGIVEFRKELRFDREFRLRLAAKLVAFATTISMALVWKNYWALVIGTLSSQVALVVLSYIMSDYRPSLTLARWREIFRFSTWIMLASVFGALLTRSPSLIIGRFANVSSVGLYEVGREVADLPTTELVWPIARTLYPGYSKVMGNTEKIRQLYLDSIGLIITLATPLALGIAVTAEPLVCVLLGIKWLEAVPFIEVLAVSGLIRLFSTGAQSIILAQGRPKLYALLALFSLLMTLPLSILGAWQAGAIGVAYGFLGGMVLSSLAYLTSSYLLLQLSAKVIIHYAYRPLFSGLGMVIAIWSLLSLMMEADTADFWRALRMLAILAPLGATVYITTLLLLWRLAGKPAGPEHTLLREINQRWPRLKYWLPAVE
ncbi:MAG: lipopolysaccharide biosynthesis protein [Gammaproteobacteria bacterium]|nr:lipopolysaccharide biosynthesis protein [Gammaproteobacteria bacterium]